MVGNIYHVDLTVRDPDRSAAWYHKVLGFERTGGTALPAVHAGRCSCGMRASACAAMPYLTGRTSNAGCLAAMARIWSSLESGPVPSKKIPTSAFHLLR